MHIEVYTDGSATVAEKPGGYGFVICIDGAKKLEGSGHMPYASNNDAELEAAIKGLTEVKNYLSKPIDILGNYEAVEIVPPEVTLVSDSQLILGWADGTYKFRQHDKMEKFKSLQLLVYLMNVKTRWVEGHTGDEHNERCDELANEARLGVQRKVDKVEAIMTGQTLIGNKKTGIACLWYRGVLKVIDLDQNIIEDYNRDVHGTRGSMLEIKEEKFR